MRTHTRKLIKKMERYFGKSLMLKEISDMVKPLTQSILRENQRKNRRKDQKNHKKLEYEI